MYIDKFIKYVFYLGAISNISTSTDPYFTVSCAISGLASDIRWYYSDTSEPYTSDRNHTISTQFRDAMPRTQQSSLTLSGDIQPGVYTIVASVRTHSTDGVRVRNSKF